MPNKLSRYCDGVMEAAWLAAIALIPIFFNVYSSRIFEPDKIALLRSLALVILAAWMIKLFSEGGPRWESRQPGDSLLKFIIKFPLAGAVLAFVFLYFLSTLFSVAPRTSLWGSYQRLQGTYTTFSYLIVFAAILGNLRSRKQVDRVITTAVLASLPIVLYGFLQHYKRDPIPWAGDTSLRIAANMGNSIFVAAYLIMVFPLTIGRIVQSFAAILKEESRLWSHMARATIYVFIAASQLIALYMSQSRGPMLGLLAGTFFLFLLLSLYWQKRWLTVSTVAIALALGIFLVVFNIQGGPLESLRKSTAFGRFGMLLDPESNSALVRKYIWQGAADLVEPHEPLEYPDGNVDKFNGLRPLIGYGPETMYVAYNPFYVPELAIVERRNASPDRSHNETWDALVITGVLGIIAYLFLFTLVFYYGLNWIGLIITRRQRNLFLSLWLGSGGVGAAGMILWRGIEYFGVGLPFGMLIGLLIYLTLVAISGNYRAPETRTEKSRYLLLIVLIAAIVSHFVEINFGIAIVATRTYFWVYSALLVILGYLLPRKEEEESDLLTMPANKVVEGAGKQKGASGARKKRHSRESIRLPGSNWLVENREPLISAMLLSMVLVTLVFNFVSNSRGLSSVQAIFWNSLTQLPNRDFAASPGLFWMFLTTWLFMAIVMSAESSEREQIPWWKGLGIVLLGSLIPFALYAWVHANALASIATQSANTLDSVLQQVGRFEGLLTRFYVAFILIVLVLAILLPERKDVQLRLPKLAGILFAPTLFILVIFLIFFSNLRIIQADIVYKIAEPFSRNGQWPVAITIYNRANQLAPNEDYYFLFLGRAYLEHAKTLDDLEQRDRVIEEAEGELLKAQALNPLNTDHTANLARLYSLWASYTTEPKTRQERGEISSDYFSKALKLSRNSALLWDEWAYLLISILQQPEAAFEKINRAIEIDPQYHRSYALMGEYYLRKSVLADGTTDQDALERAANSFSNALEMPAPGEPAARFNYAQMLASIYVKGGRYQPAIDAYLKALEVAPQGVEVWRIREAIAGLYVQTGDTSNALLHLQYALNEAPDDQKDRLRALLTQLQAGGQP